MSKIKLPKVDVARTRQITTFPFNGKAVTEKSFSYSFSCFDRTHELFNLGDNTSDGVISGKWFLDLFDCLKSVSSMTISEVKASMHDLHPIDWSKTNTSAPKNSEQCEFWQFRINKSKGRVIGFLIDGVFYVVWLDPHHNLTDSKGYGSVNRYRGPMSIYESQVLRIEELENQLKDYEKLLGHT